MRESRKRLALVTLLVLVGGACVVGEERFESFEEAEGSGFGEDIPEGVYDSDEEILPPGPSAVAGHCTVDFARIRRLTTSTADYFSGWGGGHGTDAGCRSLCFQWLDARRRAEPHLAWRLIAFFHRPQQDDYVCGIRSKDLR